MLKRLRYGQKVLFILAVVFLLISGGLFVTYRVALSGLIAEHGEKVRKTARLHDSLIKTRSDDLRRLLDLIQANRTLVEYVYIASVLGGETDPLLSMIKPIYVSQKIDVFALYDMKGNVVLDLDTLKDNAGIRALREDAHPFDTTFGYALAGGRAMAVAMGPLRHQGALMGYVMLGKYVDTEFLRGMSDISGEELVFVRDGIIAASSLDGEFGEFLPGDGKVTLGGVEYSIEGRDIHCLTGDCAGTFITAVSREDLRNSKNRLKLWMFATLGATAIASFGLGLLLINAMVRPLNRMVSFVDKVGKGEFDRKIEVSGRDEVAVLSERFNDMQSQLSAQREALKRYAGGLELAVEERTRELREAEARLFQSQKMESLGTMAGGIAHDFNNLLAAMLGYASFVKEDMDRSHPHYRYWDIVEQAALRGTELTSRLLAFSKGGMALRPKEPVNINSLIGEVLTMLGRTFDKSIAISTNFFGERLFVYADSGALYQAVLNICLNARDAMPSGGTLSIETSPFNASESFGTAHYQVRPGPYVRINISDTGQGIDKKDLSRVFDPFFTTKSQGKGTGLGLAITYSVVKGHGGVIDVYSEPGVGTIFKLYLPMFEGEVEASSEEPLRLDAEGQATVLVVDDEEPLRNLSKEILESAKYKVALAPDGGEALRVYEAMKDEISLVILDIVMPGISAHETLIGLRAMNPSLPVLISSGFSKEIGIGWAEEQGVSGFIEKPYRARSLLLKVKEALRPKDVS